MTNGRLRLAIISSDEKRARALANPDGITTDLYNLRLRSFARTPYDHLFTELGTLDSAETALASGCDAIFIDTFADYAIDRIRTISSASDAAGFTTSHAKPNSTRLAQPRE